MRLPGVVARVAASVVILPFSGFIGFLAGAMIGSVHWGNYESGGGVGGLCGLAIGSLIVIALWKKGW